MLWLRKPWRSFIVILSVTQLILGIVKRIEKHYICYDYSFKGHKTCPYVRPFHDAMIFKSCLRFESWRYVTHSFAHHGTPHLLINLAFQVIFGKNPKHFRTDSINQFLVYSSAQLLSKIQQTNMLFSFYVSKVWWLVFIWAGLAVFYKSEYLFFFQAAFLSLSNLADIPVKGLQSCTSQVYCSVSWQLHFGSTWKLKDAVEGSLVLLEVI